MNQYEKFKQYMNKLGAKCYAAKPNTNAFFTLGKCIEIQVTSHNSQHETDLVAVSVALRKNGYYFPLGDCWALNALELVEKIDKILMEYDINCTLNLKASW